MEKDNASERAANLAALGRQYFGDGDYKSAIGLYREALKVQPRQADLWFDLSLTLRRLKKPKEALFAAKKAIKLSPSVPDYWLCLGNVYKDLEWLRMAEDAYWKALGFDSDYVSTLNNLALLYLQQDKTAQAQQLLLRAVALDSKDAVVRLNLGTSFEVMGQIESAVACYKKASELSPTYHRPIEKLIEILRPLRGDYAVAEYESQLHWLKSIGYS